MSYSLLSAQDAREVRGLAGRAPSLFNLQPWRFREEAGALELLLDRAVALPETDPVGAQRPVRQQREDHERDDEQSDGVARWRSERGPSWSPPGILSLGPRTRHERGPRVRLLRVLVGTAPIAYSATEMTCTALAST